MEVDGVLPLVLAPELRSLPRTHAPHPLHLLELLPLPVLFLLAPVGQLLGPLREVGVAPPLLVRVLLVLRLQPLLLALLRLLGLVLGFGLGLGLGLGLEVGLGLG